MGVTPRADYEITRYEDGCVWGRARVRSEGIDEVGEWKYPSDMGNDKIVLCLGQWAAAVWLGEEDPERLYMLATEFELLPSFCHDRSRLR